MGSTCSILSGLLFGLAKMIYCLDLEVSLSSGYKPGTLGQHKCDSSDKTEIVLDGPGGERITSLDTFYTEDGWFTGFQVCMTLVGMSCD